MIYLIAQRIKFAESAAHFLKLPRGSWRFVVEPAHLYSARNEPGDMFVQVYAPRWEPNVQDRERTHAIREFLKAHQVQTVSYTLP